MSSPSFVAILAAGAPVLVRGAGGAAGAEAREQHLVALREAVGLAGGREVRVTADGLVARFGSAVPAVACAAAMQRATAELPGGGALRVGLDAGEPELGGGGGDAEAGGGGGGMGVVGGASVAGVGGAGAAGVDGVGDEALGRPVLVAERLCAMAGDGEVLVSEVVRLLAAGRLPGAAVPSGALRLPGERETMPVASVRWQGDGGAGEPGGVDGADDGAARGGSAAQPITVVIADDQGLVRAGLRVMLDAEPDLEVVGEAPDGRTAVDLVARRRPDVVLMDIRMPELDGLTAAERVLADPDRRTAVVMLTTFDASEYVYRALRIGASGFLLKDTPSDRLLDAVRVAAAGDALIAPSITRRLIGEFTRAAGRREPGGGVPEALRDLTTRELEVFGHVARGLSNAEIAAELVLGENTVKTHVARMLGKLGLRDRVQAVVLAYESGLVVPDDGAPA